MTSQEAINQCVLQAHASLGEVQARVEADRALATGKAEWDETPFEAASHMGRKDIAEYLLAHGASLDIYGAAMLGRETDVEQFLSDDPTLAASTGVHAIPILYFPAVAGQLSVARRLLAAGAPINAGAGGNTPLHGAAISGNSALIEWMLDSGADRAATNFDGKTPAEVALAAGLADAAELLGGRST